jgi:dTDP-4-amino-4,6-dideoxygalactose transaminase
MIHWWETQIGAAEIDGIGQSIHDRHISQGPVTEALERRLAEHLDVPHVVLTSSGSSALLMALMACGVGPNDEVILPNRTFIATANAPLLLGATVRLADVERDRPVIDPLAIEPLITPRTKAVMVVHLNGRSADMDGVKAIAAKHGLKVIEDAAQAFCSRNACGYLGTQGDVGAFSLGITKLITIGQGGFVTTRDDDTYDTLRRLRNHGSVKTPPSQFDEFGFNFKITDMLAAMGLKQTEKLPQKIDRHKAVYSFYESALKDLDFIRVVPVNLAAGELPLWVETLCEERDTISERLHKNGVQTRPLPPSLCDAGYLRATGTFPNSKIFAEQGLILPCGPDQPDENLKATVAALRQTRADA